MNIIAFDLFGTVFDLSGVPRQEIRDYVHHIRQPEWAPLHLPKSWEQMPAHPDSREGISRLRKRFIVVTCSNGPLGLTTKMCRHSGIQFDAIIPLELSRVYKTNPRAYLTVCDVLDVEPKQVRMVTANKDFGDLEASAALGMEPTLIRGHSGFRDIIDLAKYLGC